MKLIETGNCVCHSAPGRAPRGGMTITSSSGSSPVTKIHHLTSNTRMLVNES